MQKYRTQRRVRRLGVAVVALMGLVGVSLPLASAMAQSRNAVNSWDVDPNYHSNMWGNPCSLGYWNQGLTCPSYGFGYYGYGYGYGYPYYPW